MREAPPLPEENDKGQEPLENPEDNKYVTPTKKGDNNGKWGLEERSMIENQNDVQEMIEKGQILNESLKKHSAGSKSEEINSEQIKSNNYN